MPEAHALVLSRWWLTGAFDAVFLLCVLVKHCAVSPFHSFSLFLSFCCAVAACLQVPYMDLVAPFARQALVSTGLVWKLRPVYTIDARFCASREKEAGELKA